MQAVSAPLVETQELTKRYSRQVLAIESLNLSIGPGVTGLVGANGAGKSTLLKILLGLLKPTSGTARLLGYDVQTQGPTLHPYVGYMAEHDCLPADVSATDFVAQMARICGLPTRAARERTAEVRRHVGLFEERYRPIGTYSTGMKQRVKLAQALVHDPRLLVLDEPTNELDPAGREDMLDMIHGIGADFGISILMSSHLLGEIERVCTDVVVIDGGRLRRSDTISSFMESTKMLAVEVDSRTDELRQRLKKKRGLDVRDNGPLILIGLDGCAPYDIVRDEVVELRVGLLRLEQGRYSLEDLFRVTPEDDDRG
jgi:ABC-2 type transport system ATP-binding protein